MKAKPARLYLHRPELSQAMLTVVKTFSTAQQVKLLSETVPPVMPRTMPILAHQNPSHMRLCHTLAAGVKPSSEPLPCRAVVANQAGAQGKQEADNV